ncbi:hypothetical protein LUZ60_017451 [Juncus effusus]|nr:hypothetical protein LUZ60_017451 [Juncus effusus]
MTAVMATNGPATRSQLEVMLDSLMKREEKPKDLPPALPARPPSRGRLPSARKSLPPIRFKNGESSSDLPWEESKEDLKEENGSLVKKEEEEGGEREVKDVDQINKDLPNQKDKKESEEKLELERRAEKAESEVVQMKEEFSTLEKQILDYKEMCMKYESQIKNLENELDKKEKEITASLQVRKSENTNGIVNQENQEIKQQISPNNPKQNQNPVGTLMKEFETQKRNFEEGAKALAQTGHNNNPLEDLKKLKAQFFAWRKDYRAKLHETKIALEKAVYGKKKRSWWGKKCSKH